jgi:hypothetical protein
LGFSDPSLNLVTSELTDDTRAEALLHEANLRRSSLELSELQVVLKGDTRSRTAIIRREHLEDAGKLSGSWCRPKPNY